MGGPAAWGMVMKVQELGAGGGSEFLAILRVNSAAVDRPLGLIAPVPRYRLFEFAPYSPPHQLLADSLAKSPQHLVLALALACTKMDA